MKIKQAVNKAGKTDSDVIIVHAATNDLRSSTPEKLASEITNTLKSIQENNPTSKIAFSSIFRRQDKELNAKATKVNKMLEEELMLNGFDVIDNKNILFSNLATDGLHINQGGARKFAGNIINFIKYC